MTTAKALDKRPKRRGFVAFITDQRVAPYVFVLPFVLAFLLIYVYSGVYSTYMSLFKIDGPTDWTFVAFRNYERLFANKHFHAALWNNVRYTFWTLLILIPLPMLLAVLLNSKHVRGRNVMRSALFTPALTSVVCAGVIFKLIFSELDSAVVNSLLISIGIPAVTWTKTAWAAMFLMVILCTWRWLGVNIVYYLSGLQAIPTDLYEAAEIDGANSFQRFWRITVPMLRSTTIYVLTISIVGGFGMFVESFVFWQNASPNDIGLTIVGYLYKQNFELNNMGMGSAIGITFLVIVLTINVLQLKVFGAYRKEG